MYIGNKIKALRKKRKLTLVELSKASGVQVATLSRMENMKMVGTLESHIAIARVLGVDVTQLYAETIKDQGKIDAFEEDIASDVFVHSETSSYEILTKNLLSKKMMPILIKIEPESKTNSEQNPVGSEKFVFVLEGTVDVIIESKTISLSKNKTLYFDSSLKHQFHNIGKAQAKVICVGTPVML